MEATFLRHFNSTGPALLLISSVWQGLLLTACVWLGLKLASAFGLSLRASTRFTLWLLVFLLVAFLPGLALLRIVLTGHAVAAPLRPAAEFSLRLNLSWAIALEGLWVVTSLFSLMRLLASGTQMRSLFVRSTPVAFADLEDGLRAMVSRRRERPVQIRLSEATDAPSVIGFFRPAVVMPRSLWNELSPAELRQIVLHELAHLERGDDWTNLLQKLLRALCPLNPALLWAERHLCRERERACDDAVIEAAGNARAYATCLTKLAESRLVRRAASLAPGLWKRPSELASRVDNILHRRSTLGPLLSRGLLTAGLLAMATGAVLLQRSPGLIAFTGNAPLAARAVAPDTDLASATVVRARYNRHDNPGFTPAGYHEAVFHPEMKNTSVPLGKHAATALRPRARRSHPVYSSGLRLVQLGNTPDGSEVFTLVLFTVEVPRNTRLSHGTLPLAEIPALSFSDHWIAFQI